MTLALLILTGVLVVLGFLAFLLAIIQFVWTVASGQRGSRD